MYEHLEKQLKKVRKNYKKDDTSWGNVWSLGCIKGLEQAQDWVKEAQKLPKEQIEQTYHNLNDKLTEECA
jgi:hypothetical protein